MTNTILPDEFMSLETYAREGASGSNLKATFTVEFPGAGERRARPVAQGHRLSIGTDHPAHTAGLVLRDSVRRSPMIDLRRE